MLSNSDLYPNVWVCAQILAELSLSAALRRPAANGNLTHLKSVFLFSTARISRSWLICWLASKGFADALCELDYIYVLSVQQYGGLLITDLQLWEDWTERAVASGVQKPSSPETFISSCFFINLKYFLSHKRFLKSSAKTNTSLQDCDWFSIRTESNAVHFLCINFQTLCSPSSAIYAWNCIRRLELEVE